MADQTFWYMEGTSDTLTSSEGGRPNFLIHGRYRRYINVVRKAFNVSSLSVGWLLNVPATCKCISGTDLLRQFYVLPHWDRNCRSNFLPHPVTDTDTGPTSPSTDPIMPGAWQGSHWSANFEVTRPRKNFGASGIRTRDLPLSGRTP